MLPPAPLSRKAEEGGLGGQAGGVAVVGGEASFFGGLLRRKQQAKEGKEPRQGLTRSSSMPHNKVVTRHAAEERL